MPGGALTPVDQIHLCVVILAPEHLSEELCDPADVGLRCGRFVQLYDFVLGILRSGPEATLVRLRTSICEHVLRYCWVIKLIRFSDFQAQIATPIPDI